MKRLFIGSLLAMAILGSCKDRPVQVSAQKQRNPYRCPVLDTTKYTHADTLAADQRILEQIKKEQQHNEELRRSAVTIINDHTSPIERQAREAREAMNRR